VPQDVIVFILIGFTKILPQVFHTHCQWYLTSFGRTEFSISYVIQKQMTLRYSKSN